jgi:hypothetical protein
LHSTKSALGIVKREDGISNIDILNKGRNSVFSKTEQKASNNSTIENQE